ncbi:hypothetical protein CF319_g477 [Tilletia indica]|nr:hypothetical protein CF319_g477 [Tilletia indica]
MRFTIAALALTLAATSAFAAGKNDTAAAAATGGLTATAGTPSPDQVAALAKCSSSCTSQAAKAAGCKDESDLACWCKSDKFGKHASDCVQKDCAQALPFVFPELQKSCEAAKQTATFKWPNVTASASASGAGAAAAGGATATAGNTTNTTGAMDGMTNMDGMPTNPGAPTTDKKSGAGLAADFVWPAVFGVATFSAGLGLVL